MEWSRAISGYVASLGHFWKHWIALSVLSQLFFFLPLVVNGPVWAPKSGSFPSSAVVSSTRNQILVYSTLAAFLTKFLFELLDSSWAERSNPGQFTRWGIIGTQLVYCFITIAFVFPTSSAGVYWSCLAFRDYNVVAFAVAFLHEVFPSVWTPRLSGVVLILVSVGTITREYALFTFTFSSATGIVSFTLFAVSTVLSSHAAIRTTSSLLRRGWSSLSLMEKSATLCNVALAGALVVGTLTSLDWEDLPNLGANQGVSVYLLTDFHVVTYNCYINVVLLFIVVGLSRVTDWSQEAANREVLQTKRTFVRYVGHEIRTPLNVVCMGIQLLQNGVSLKSQGKGVDMNDETMVDVLNDLQNSTKEAIKILDQLLMYEKIEGNLYVLNSSRVSVLDFFARNTRSFDLQAAAEHKTITLEVTDERLSETLKNSVESGAGGLSDVPPFMEADDFRLSQCLRNLTSNALKFSPRGSQVIGRCSFRSRPGEDVSIDSSLDLDASRPCSLREATHVRFEVVDQGTGMDSETQLKIGTEGFQFKPGELQSHGGSGLGLYISKGIIQRHRGRMGVSSAGRGRGSTVYFEVPLLPSGGEVGASSNGSSNGGGGSSSNEELCDNSAKLSNRKFTPVGLGTPRSQIHKRNSYDNLATSILKFTGGYSSSSVAPAPEHQKMTPVVPDAMLTALEQRGEQETKSEGGMVSVQGGLRILVVDDSKLNRKFTQRLVGQCMNGLERRFSLAEAEDGVEGNQLITKSMEDGMPFDLVLMDHQMPNRLGPECSRLAFQGGFGGRIVGLTGCLLEDDLKVFADAGVSEVIEKPLSFDKLKALLITCIPSK